MKNQEPLPYVPADLAKIRRVDRRRLRATVEQLATTTKAFELLIPPESRAEIARHCALELVRRRRIGRR